MKALILLSSLGVISLFAEIFNFKKWLFPIVLLGVLGTIALAIGDWSVTKNYPLFNNMFVFDNYAIAFSCAFLATGFLWFFMAQGYFSDETNLTDHFAIILFSLVGAVLLVSYNNMTMLFLGIEILSISLYVLCGSKKTDVLSNESAFKYFLMGAFATGFLLFGIALIYGSTGSFDLTVISQVIAEQKGVVSPLFYGGVLMMLFGLLFKISAVPFHFWSPDVYQGAPTVITAYMSTVVKAAAFAGTFRLFSTTFASSSAIWSDVMWVITALTLVIGNITAVSQNSVKRMLAFSGISHAGYMLLAVVALSRMSSSSILFYTIAYSIASIGAFSVLQIIIQSKQTDEVDAFNGLAKNNPLMAFAMTVALLSLAGIPPAAGFFAKYYIFSGAISAGYTGLVVLAVISSLIGIYYYFRIIMAMFSKESLAPETYVLTPGYKLLIVLTAVITIALGLFPDFIIKLI